MTIRPDVPCLGQMGELMPVATAIPLVAASFVTHDSTSNRLAGIVAPELLAVMCV